MSKAENTTDYSKLAEKEATELHQNFAAWIEEKTGFAPDLKSVQLAVTLRMAFQASEENQKHLADRRAKAEADKRKRAAEKKQRLEKQLADLQAQLAETSEAPASMPAKKAAPAKKTTASKPAVAKVEDKPAPARTGRPRKAASKVTPDVPADFDADDLTDSNNATPVKRTRTRRTATTTK